MSDPEIPTAKHHSSLWPGWIWSVPIAAVGIAIWLAVRSFAASGPTVTVIFPEVADVKAGDTLVKFQHLTVGKVDSVRVERDLRHIKVKLDLHSDLAGHLGPGTKFWIAGGQPSLTDLASIRSIISGPSIAIDPAPGRAQSVYQGLGQRPALSFGESGTTYVLRADTHGSIQRGTPIYYLGQQVGVVKNVHMVEGRSFEISAFVDKPYDQFVRANTRFWSAGAVRLDTGGTGPAFEFQSLPALVRGAIDFETPSIRHPAPLSHGGDGFTLYADKDAALFAPGPDAVLYRLQFPEAAGALAANAAVTFQGTRIGSVLRSRLLYDPSDGSAGIDAVIAIDADRIALPGKAHWTNPRVQMNAMLNTLLAKGMRAALVSSPPLIGGETVALRPMHAAPATLTGGPIPIIPTTHGGGIAGIISTANDIVSKVDGMPLPQIADNIAKTAQHTAKLTGSPELGETLRHLERTSQHADHMMATLDHRIPPMLTQLRHSVAATTAALDSAQHVLASGSSGPNNPQAADLPDTLYEVKRAARSLRELTDFLNRHPEALISGRGKGG